VTAGYARSCPSLRVDHERYRTVIQEFDGHPRAEPPALCAELRADSLDERLGLLRRGGVDEARAVALTRVAVEREVRHDEDIAADVTHGQVHLAVVVLEHAQRRQLCGHLVGFGFAVACAYPEEHEQAAVDRSYLLPVARDGRRRNALHYRAHRRDPNLEPMAAVDVIAEYIEALPGETRRVAHTEWGVTLDEERGGGWPLDVGLRLADGLLRVQAFALPYRDGLDFGQVLHWNRQTRMARFGCTRSGDIWVHADLPVEAVNPEQLDRLLGLVVEGALNVRAYAGRL
jgi:hypothetical protein